MLYLSLAGGLILLLAGGELFVRGAVAVARRLGVSTLFVGLVLVGFGTSSPELVASLRSALVGAPDVATGNVVGSNIANVLLVLGVAALVAPVRCERRALLRDGVILAMASVLLLAVCYTPKIGRLEGGVAIALLLAYVALSYFRERRRPDAGTRLHVAEAETVATIAHALWAGMAVALAGLAGVLFGASVFVDAAVEIARLGRLSEAAIGLTVVAVGTSLPELAIAVVATYRGHGEVALGDVVGSNIYNILGILGVTALVRPLPVPEQIASFDIWVMLGTVLVLMLFGTSGWRVSRVEGLVMLAGYALYVGAVGRMASGQ